MNACRNRFGQAGAALPLTAVALPVLLLAIAFGLVFSQVFAVRYELWHVADLAALAAARQVSEASLWDGKPSLDADAARDAVWQALRDNGLSSADAGLTVEIRIEEGRVIRARKAAPEVTVKVCRETRVPFGALAGRGVRWPVCAEARAAVLRPKRLLPQ